MRDILLTLIMLVLLPMAIRRPMIGALLWAWVSIMNPHQFTYGFANRVPWAMIIAIITLLGLLSARHRKPLPWNAGTALLLMLTVWMTITSFFALQPDTAVVWSRWLFVFKILLMLFATLMLIRGRHDIELLVWVIVLSLGFFGVKGGIWTLATGGSMRVWGPPTSMIEGNNELAVALVLVMPWMHYLREVSAKRWIKLALLGSMIACALAILGTQSRGALLAIVAMGFVLGLKGKYPVRTSLALVLVGLLILAFMPETWSTRMDTIQSYQQDQSAQSRVYTWKTLWNVAKDHPFVGAGFRADNLVVFNRYGHIEGFEQFWDLTYVAHSIYFQALGEHGFVGLAIYLLLGIWVWFAAAGLARQTTGDPEFGAWVPSLMRMSQVSLVGFAVGGAFLSLMLFDVPYYIAAVVILTLATVKEQRRAQATAAQSAATADTGALSHVISRQPPP